MIEILLITTPVLLLAVVALLAFNSCSFHPRPAVGIPQNLKAVPGDGQITLSWDGTTDAKTYTLTRTRQSRPGGPDRYDNLVHLESGRRTVSRRAQPHGYRGQRKLRLLGTYRLGTLQIFVRPD